MKILEYPWKKKRKKVCFYQINHQIIQSSPKKKINKKNKKLRNFLAILKVLQDLKDISKIDK